MKNLIVEGDTVRCIKTVAIDGRPKGIIAVKGRIYPVRSVIHCCCGPCIDIGYAHYTHIINICAQCGSKRKEKDPIYIPATYFKRARLPVKDVLHEVLNELERHFIFLNQ